MPELADASQQKCPACGTVVNVVDIEPLARIECPQCGEKFRVERVFDNFVLVETLGVGGMGSVYKARDTRLDRFVALKLLRKELSADPAEAARLEQEARFTAAVNHPNVVQVYSSGTAHGQIYLVMELVDHGSLDDLMAQKSRVPEVQVLRAGIQVARGLQAAHEKGLIHRDVKPANILFADEQTAKIGDFGLAGAAEEKAEARKEIWGTPYYVAPERLNNEPEDFRSDIYSLGATLFHAIAGKPPMEGETTSAAELRELKSHPPDLRVVAPEVKSETADVINRMLAPSPADRFESYKDLIDELLLAYGEVTGTSSKKPRWLIAAAIVFLALIVGGAFLFYQRSLAKARSAVPSGISPQQAALQTHFTDARRLIVEGKYDPALVAFNKLAIEASPAQPLTNWARLHVGLCALLLQKPGPARDAFQLVERNAAFSTAKSDTPLVTFFTETSRALSAATAVRANALPELKSKSVDVFAPFLFAMKDWQLREFSEGVPLLEKFVENEPPNELSWINDYKPLAKKFLEDAKLYADWKQSSERLTSADELHAGIAKVKSLQGKLQLRTALFDYFKEEGNRLNSLVARNEKEAQEKAKQEQVTKAQQDRQEFESEKPRWLAQWKSQLIKDLKTGAYTGAIQMPGTTYQGVQSASEDGVMVRAGNYGCVLLRWEKFQPGALLALSTFFIKPGAPDAADRQWLCAVFAYSSGQSEAGKTLAEAAAKTKPDYRERLSFLTETTPNAR